MAKENGNGKAATPLFDFSRLSIKASQRQAMLKLKADLLDRKRLEGDLAQVPEVLEEIGRNLDAQQAHVCSCLVSVPSEWLVVGAPDAEKIDWSNPESLEWLRADKWYPLNIAFTEAQRGN